MTIWLNAHLSPAIAVWITATFGITAIAVRDLGLRESEDTHIFEATKAAGDVILMTKDRDFIEVERYRSPPQVIWLTCGNTSNDRLKEIMTATLANAIELLRLGESVVEITGN
jgi:predicted nuclease of predicted toxin-antitoxin system